MKANTQHTPGPWHRNISAKYPVYAGTDKTNWKHIAGVLAVDRGDDRHDGPETDANLNLIAAVPELLQSCRELVEGLGFAVQGELTAKLIERAKAAIAKAEGREAAQEHSAAGKGTPCL